MTQQRKFAILPVLALLTACSQNVEVKPSFPDPLAEALPITVSVHYTAELTDFSYNEELPGDTVDWTFNIGSANQLMFEKTFGAVFDELLVVDNVRANNVDVVLQRPLLGRQRY